MRYPKFLISSLLMTLTTPALVAQAPSAWSQVLLRPQDQVHIQARVVTLDGVSHLQFRNEGQDQVNFYYSVNGEDPFTNPRLRLKAHKRSPYIPLPAGATVQTMKFVLLRIGPDQGPVLPI